MASTVDAKAEALQRRLADQKRIGVEVDSVIIGSDAADAGCLCSALRAGLERAVGVRRGGATRIVGKKLDQAGHAQFKLDSAARGMQDRLEKLEARAAEHRAAAADAARAGNKALGLRELRRAKALERQAASVQTALAAVEQQADVLQNASLQREVASAIGASAKSLKKDKKLLEKAEAAADSAVEMRDLSEDVQSVLSSIAESTADNDEDELLAELDLMTAQPAREPARAPAIDPAVDSAYADLEKLRQLPKAPRGPVREKDALLPAAEC